MEIASFNKGNTYSNDTRKGLYDGIERDLKAIWNEVAGFDLHKGYYLAFRKNEDGSWGEDFAATIKVDEAYLESHIRRRNEQIEKWLEIPALKALKKEGELSRYPTHTCSIFQIEASHGSRWNEKCKLVVGPDYGFDVFTPKALAEEPDLHPVHKAYSYLQDGKYKQLKTDKPYRLFKHYVQLFFETLKDVEAGYNKAEELAKPHADYLAKLESFEAVCEKLNDKIHSQLNPDAKPEHYRRTYVEAREDRIYLSNCVLNSEENIDVASQILELIDKLKFAKQS